MFWNITGEEYTGYYKVLFFSHLIFLILGESIKN